jgi:SP family facilitated glucose transporter-like MFS transporter 10
LIDLFTGLGLVILQQVTGQPNILYYADDLFQAVGFCGDVLSAMAAIGNATTRLRPLNTT